VYCEILAYPASPSFCSRSRDGITIARTWKMIEAVTYGMIPSAKSEKRESAEPEKRFNRPRTPLPPEPPKKVFSACSSTPGAGTQEPRR
jgi:hypothetical protein